AAEPAPAPAPAKAEEPTRTADAAPAPPPAPAQAAPAEPSEGARWQPLKPDAPKKVETAEAPAPEPEPAIPAGRRATRILAVTHDQEKGQVAVTIRGDGRLRYQDFFLGNPDRLVVDFTDVTSRAAVRSVEINRDP